VRGRDNNPESARAPRLGFGDADAENESDWPRQQEWLAKRVDDMHRAFAQRVASLIGTSELAK